MPKRHPRQADDVDLHVASRVRALRRAREWSQTALGEKIGITYQQVQKYERGANRLTVGRLVQISRVLGAPLGEFLPKGVSL